MPWSRSFMILMLGFLLCACQQPQTQVDHLQRIQQRGELVVLTREAPTSYYQSRTGTAGPEYDMARNFAATLGVPVRFELVPNMHELIERLALGEADIGAAGIVITPERQNRLAFGPAYQTVEQQVVCRHGKVLPQSVTDLSQVRLRVAAHSNQEEHLRLQKILHPELQWQSDETATPEQLLEQVWEGQADCTIADSNIVAVNKRYYPGLRIAFSLKEKDQLAWAMPPNSRALRLKLEQWFRNYQASGQLAEVKEHYYGTIGSFAMDDVRQYQKLIEKRLPRYRGIFQRAAAAHGLPWTLLAALSYQESQWQPDAENPSGVAGLMMLGPEAAAEVGVEDRFDPAENIMGAARYLAQLYERLPDAVTEPNRTWLALAAYNMGLGHIQDAQELATSLGRNPYSWYDIKEVLPLLSKPRYYRQLRYGYARGIESVQYVQRIRAFEDMLIRTLARKNQMKQHQVRRDGDPMRYAQADGRHGSG